MIATIKVEKRNATKITKSNIKYLRGIKVEKKRHWKIKLLLKNHIIYLKEI